MMEYQIVPNCKHGQVKTKKHRTDDICKKCEKARHGEDSNVYILQPMLKLPKSTREVKNAGNDEASLVVNAVKASNKCPSEKEKDFNHFTMSRKGLVKGIVSPNNNMSRTENPWGGLSPHLLMENKGNANEKSDEYNGYMAYHRRASRIEGSNKKMTKEKIVRRASAGDALVMSKRTTTTNTIQEPPRVLTIGPDEMLVIPQRKLSKTPLQQDNGQYSGPSSASGSKVEAQRDDRLRPEPEYKVPRRKSFHDWYSMRQWYAQEERPVSCERRHSERRNVISPTTLSRLIQPDGNPGDSRQGSAPISVCTEGDMMSYNFSLPSRRLVSHKELKACNLPYSDNIGLEETVSSDQARGGAKLKQSMAVKKKYENSKQTPKQVWYRTVRSILAANHLYHQVKNKRSS